MSTVRLITVQGPLSWKGSYADAQNRANRLEKECTICFEEYKPSEQVIILPCNHGLHSKCFEKWEQQNCPFDRKFIQFEKVFLLGQEIAFNPQARKCAIWVSSELDKINADLEKLIVEIFNPEELDKFRKGEDGILRRLAPLIKIIAQDFLDRYAGTPLNTHDGRFSTDDHERAVQLVEAANQAVHDFSNEILARALDSNIMEKIKIYCYTAVFDQISGLVSEFFNGIDVFDEKKISSANWLIHTYVETLRTSTEFAKIIEEVDRQFYQRHFEELSQIAGENDTYVSRIKIAYFLHQMKDFRFISINRNEESPLALRVKHVEEIETYTKAYTISGCFVGLLLLSALTAVRGGINKIYSFF